MKLGSKGAYTDDFFLLHNCGASTAFSKERKLYVPATAGTDRIEPGVNQEDARKGLA